MTSDGFIGRVFVVAGSEPLLGAVADALTAADALVAVIGDVAVTAGVAAHFRADATDVQVWNRAVPHAEQRLGPIDGVVADESTRAIAERLLEADLRRRGHGAVVTVARGDDQVGVLRRLGDTL